MVALTAWVVGLWRVCRAPWILAIVYVLLLLVTMPIAARMHLELPEPSRPFAVEPGAGPIPDFDWLDEVTANKRSLLGELVPSVIGVAAPLSNIDALLDGRTPLFALLVSGVMLIAWAWLWGGIIANAATPRRRFFKACQDSFSAVLALNIAGLVLALLAYWIIHGILFGLIWPLVDDSSEPIQLIWRTLFTLITLIGVATVAAVFDYARISLVLLGVKIPEAIGVGTRFVRAHLMSVGLLVVLTVMLFGGLLAVYAAFEFIPGGSVPTLGRIVVLGQAYIAARIVLRLWNASAQVVLFERIRIREASE
jgi:hypothetical protein